MQRNKKGRKYLSLNKRKNGPTTQSKSQVKAASDLKLYAKKLYQEQCSTTKENDLLVHINSSLLIL